ncbi:alpha/beta fold hydrolase [Pseudonocardia xinjiangensis]|nr:alpha/beta hydrolase [Pseudonocardia xinjiangensis]
MPMHRARLHDGASIEVEVRGAGPAVLLPVNPRPVEGPQADAMREWGVDPALGRGLVDGLADAYRVVAFDYEGHVFATPKPHTLTPANVVRDMLAVADAAGVDRFAWYGYSWLALSGLQIAIRTDRLWALAMGGFPPIGGPYAEMLQVTLATHRMATELRPVPTPSGAGPSPDEIDWSTVDTGVSEPQARQFVTLYEALQDFDDAAVQPGLTCPRLCFAGSADEIEYGERWGGVHVSMAGPLAGRRAELEAHGWQVHVLPGLDHTSAMQVTNVLPVLRPWLAAAAELIC